MSYADRVEGATAGPRRCFRSFARALVAVLGVAFAASQFAEPHFMLDNLSNFPAHFAGAFLLCSVLLAILRDPRFALVAAAGVAIAVMPVVPWYFPGPAEPLAHDAKTLKLVVSNVYIHNRRHAKLARLIDEVQPDVIGLVEVNSAWLRKLDDLRSAYAFHFEVPDDAPVGLALYSKLPLSNARILNVGGFGTSAIAATIETPDGEVELILAHPMSPLDADHLQRRNAQLRALGLYVSQQERPVVLAGDLNATMWNRHYREFAELGSMYNARAGHGVGPTWPAVPWLGVPIDHVLATAPVRFRNFRVLDGVGSDHLPVSAEFSLR